MVVLVVILEVLLCLAILIFSFLTIKKSLLEAFSDIDVEFVTTCTECGNSFMAKYVEVMKYFRNRNKKRKSVTKANGKPLELVASVEKKVYCPYCGKETWCEVEGVEKFQEAAIEMKYRKVIKPVFKCVCIFCCFFGIVVMVNVVIG